MALAVAAAASQFRNAAQGELKNMLTGRFFLRGRSPGRVASTLGVVAALMFGLGFALIPLYDTFCRVLGLNGKVFQSDVSQHTGAAPAENHGAVTVEFVLTRNEGGRNRPFLSGYRPSFYFRTTDVTGEITLPEGQEMVMPGDNLLMEVELITPVAMDQGLRFAIREGGRTVGAGVVAEVIE